MKALCDRKTLLDAINMVAGVVPARSPKPILQNIKLVVEEDRSTLMATDLEVGIRARVLGVKAEELGSAVLPMQKMVQILRTTHDPELSIEVVDGQIVVRGLRAEFKLPSEDPALFPEVPDFGATAYHVVAAADLRRGIIRTMFATDVESTRYALGGVLAEFNDKGELTLVGTDGRRLARMIVRAEAEGAVTPTTPAPVIPVKALKLIEKNLADEEDAAPVHIAVQPGMSVLVNIYGKAMIYSRLVEGRFPRYQDVFPANPEVKIALEAGTLLNVVEQASIVTSDESRGVDFDFGPGRLRLASQAADVGSSHVELPIPYDGKAVEITFDPRYLTDALKTLDETDPVTAELIDHKNAAVFKTDDNYTYVVMPLTRDR